MHESHASFHMDFYIQEADKLGLDVCELMSVDRGEFDADGEQDEWREKAERGLDISSICFVISGEFVSTFSSRELRTASRQRVGTLPDS